MMFGIQDPWVALAFGLCLLSSLLCVFWGIWKWNAPPARPDEPEAEIRKWAREEDKVEEEIG